jgi:NAD(P)H-hydrate repair Nnr-like enzyme with NAD(P)H-hydrate dehydratase domain
MQDAAREAIRQAREQDMYIVIDADGLWLVQNEPEVIKGYARVILTPNVVEFQRLCQKLVRKKLSPPFQFYPPPLSADMMGWRSL